MPTAPPATAVPPPQYAANSLPQYQAFPRGEAFIARARAVEYHVHTEKWMSDSWKIYRRNCGAFCSAIFIAALVTFVFLVIFAASVGALTKTDDSIEESDGSAGAGAGASVMMLTSDHFRRSFRVMHEFHSRRDHGFTEIHRREGEASTADYDEEEKEKELKAGGVAFVLISLFLFYYLFAAPMMEGFVLASFQALRGRVVMIGDFFAGFSLIKIIAIKHIVIFIAGMIPFLGFFLRFYLSLALAFVVPLAFNHPELSRIDAMKLSMHVVNKSLCGWIFFFVFLVFINILGLFFFGLGLIITVPLSLIIIAVAYTDIFGLEGYLPLQ